MEDDKNDINQSSVFIYCFRSINKEHHILFKQYSFNEYELSLNQLRQNQNSSLKRSKTTNNKFIQKYRSFISFFYFFK